MSTGSPANPGHVARLVFVCYANHCRSPMMELLLEAALARTPAHPPLLVSSAGTHARPGLPAHPYAVRALAEHGVDASRWRSSRLDPAGVEEADLIVTAAREQRREVLAMSPEAASRTFTLLDLAADLAAAPATGADDGSVAGLLARAAAGREQRTDRAGPDLPDPMGRSLRHFRRCRRRVEAALVPVFDQVVRLQPQPSAGGADDQENAEGSEA